MKEEEFKRPALADLVDLVGIIQSDRTLSPKELRHRDREIGRQSADLRSKPIEQLRYWLRDVTEDQDQRTGDQAVMTLRLVTLLISLVGLLIGWGTALAVFYYDGSQPVNVVNVLAIFVGIQLLLLLLTLLIALPSRLTRRIPLISGFSETLTLISPGRLIYLVARFLPVHYRESLQVTLGRAKGGQAVYGPVQKWSVLSLSQVFVVAFNVSAIGCAFYLVAFSDLAFAWSTTLTMDNGQFFSLVERVAWPWKDWLPAAAPTQDLVETTRYFRLKEGILADANKYSISSKHAKAMTQWWPFLVTAMLFYGLLPRMFLLAFANWRTDSIIVNLLLKVPGVGPLFGRMNHALVETAAQEPEVHAKPLAKPVAPVVRESLPMGSATHLVNWAGVEVAQETLKDMLRKDLALDVAEIHQAGGNNPVEQDIQVIKRLKRTDDSDAVAIVVKSWEPPMLEFLDFLEDLREALGEGRLVNVIPVGANRDNQLVEPTKGDLDTWRKKLQTLGDPWLDLRPFDLEVAQ